MKCPEIAPLVPRFFDGELDGSLMRKIALHITRCADCERDLRGLEKLQSLVAGHFAAEVESIDMSSIWSTVSAQIEEKPRSRQQRLGSWQQRLGSWWDELEIFSPFTVWPAVAAAAGVFLAINVWTSDPMRPNAGLARGGEVEVDDEVAGVANRLAKVDNSAVFESIVGGVDMLMVEPETQTAVIWIDDTGEFR